MAVKTKYRVCEFDPCHNLFIHRSQTGGKFKRFCSRSCGASTSKIEYVCSRDGCGVRFYDRAGAKRKYCSQSCSARVNNHESPKRRPQGACRECGCIVRSNQIFCVDCKSVWRGNELARKVQSWVSGNSDIATYSSGELADWARVHLLELAEHKCTECGWSVPNPVTGRPILSVDHVDGNWRNNSFDNLKVLCYNCHTLTITFGSLNIGSLSGTRPFRESRRR